MNIIKQIDADTFLVEDGGRQVRVRIGNVDAHESTPDANPTELGVLAKQYVANENPQVSLSTGTDVYGRQIGAMTNSAGLDVGEILARQGLGVPMDADADEAFRMWKKNGPAPETNPAQQTILQMAQDFRDEGVYYESAGLPDFGRNDERGTGARAFARGTEGLQSNLYAFLQAVNNVAGDDAQSEEYRQKAMYHAEQAGLIRKDVQSFRDIDSLSEAATYAFELIAEETPSLLMDAALTATGAGAGAVITRRAATSAIRNRLGQEGFEKLAVEHPQLLANIRNAAGATGAKRGAGAAYVAGSYPQEAGAVQLELNREGLEDEGATALGMGAVSTLVQAAPELALAGKLLKQADVDASDLAGIVGTAKTMVKNIGTTAIAEGAAEGAATVLQKSAVALHKDDYEVFSEENIREMQEAIVAGGVMGGTLAAGGTAVGAGYRKADQIYREKRESRVAERQAALEAEQQAQQAYQEQQAQRAATGAAAEQFTPADEPKSNYGQLYTREQLMPLGDAAQDIPQNDNFNAKLDSDLSAPTAEPSSTEGAAAVAPAPEPAVEAPTVEVNDEPTTELRDEVDAPTPEIDSIEELRKHPAFVAANTAIANRFNEETDFREGLIPSSILLPVERAELELVGALTIFELSDGSILEAIDPQMVQDVMDFGFESTPPTGIMYSGPAPQAKVVDDTAPESKVSYGTGTSMVDGVYEKGNGMFAYAEMADMLADPKVMGDKADSSYAQNLENVDPLSSEFDATIDAMANRLRIYGKVDKDRVNTLLDNAALGEGKQEAVAPILRQVAERLQTFKLSNAKERSDSDRLTEDDRRLAHIQVELQRLTKSLASHGVRMGSTIIGTLRDIGTALDNGVELTPKQMSAIDSIARAARVSPKSLWKKKSKNVDRRYKKTSEKVRTARKAAYSGAQAPEAKAGGNERAATGSKKGEYTETQRSRLQTFFDGLRAGSQDELKDFANLFAQIWRNPEVDVEVQGLATDSTPESGLSIVDGAGGIQTDINGLASQADNPERIAISMETVRDRIEAVKDTVPRSVVEMINDWLIARGAKPSTVAKMGKRAKLSRAAAHFAHGYAQFVSTPQKAEYDRLQLGTAAVRIASITKEVSYALNSAAGLSDKNPRHVARMNANQQSVFEAVKRRVVASLSAAGIDAKSLEAVQSYGSVDTYISGLRAEASGVNGSGEVNKTGQALASDINESAVWAVRSGTRASYDSRIGSLPLDMANSLAELTKAGDIEGMLDLLVAAEAIPLDGNGLEQLMRSVADFNGSDLTSRLSRYIFKKGRTDAIGRKALANTPVAEFIDLQFKSGDGAAQTARLHVAGYIREKVDVILPTGSMVDEAGRAWDEGSSDTDETMKNVDRIEAIQDAYSQLLSDLIGFDDRTFGLELDKKTLLAELTDESTVLYRSPDGETITLKQLNDVITTRAYQGALRENYWSTHEASELKNRKTEAALELERVLVSLFHTLQDNDARSIMVQRIATAQGKSKFSAAKETIEEDLQRQFAALFDLVYGDNGRHLDNPNARDAQLDALLFDEPYYADFDTHKRMEEAAIAGRLSAQKLKAKRVNPDPDKPEYGKSTAQVDMGFMKTVVSNLDNGLDKDSLEPLYRQLTEARSALSKSYLDRDQASISEDISRATEAGQTDVGRSATPSDKDGAKYNSTVGLATEHGNVLGSYTTEKVDPRPESERPAPLIGPRPSPESRERSAAHLEANRINAQRDRGAFTEPDNTPGISIVDGKEPGYVPAPTRRGDLNETLRLTVNRLAEAAGLGDVRIRFSFGDESSIKYNHDEGTLGITIYGHFDLKSKHGQAAFLTHVAHELAHAVTSFESLNHADAAKVLEEYHNAVPDPATYDIDEWLADQVAVQILERFAEHEIKNNIPGTSTTRRYVARMVRRLTHLANGLNSALKSLFPGRTGLYSVNVTMKGIADALISKRRAEGFDPSVLPVEMFFNGRDITGKMAKAKAKAREMASGSTDSAFVKFFKPAAMRLEKIDRALARMFFNPPGAKQEQGMGLMDASVSTRTKLVNHFSRLYPKLDTFRSDYQDYLKTGNATTALTGIFRYAAEVYSEVNPNFKFEGIPVLMDHSEIARRGSEFRKLVSSGLNDDELAMVDELLKEFDSQGIDALDNVNLRPSNPFARQELLDKLIRSRPETQQKLAAAGFMAPPTVAGMNQFFGAVAMRTEFERLFSGFEPAKDKGTPQRTPNYRLKSRLEAIEDPDKRREAIRVISSILGFDGLRVHPAWRATQDWAISLVSAAILPLSGFASLPDPIMPFIRTRSFREAVRGMFAVGKAYMTDYKRTQEMLRALSLATNSIHDTAWSHLVANRGESSIPDKITNFLFKYNGLQTLTTISRNVSAVLAIDMIKRHASNDSQYSRDLMQQMGISRQDALALVNYINQHGTTPSYAPGGDAEQNRLHDIAQRVVTTFTNSSLIHPSKAQLPLVMNDPNFRVLTLLKPFFYGFHSVIYGGNYRAARDKMATARTLGDFILSSPMGAMPFILAFGLMMPLAALGLAGREWFKDLFVTGTPATDKLESLDGMEYFNRIFSRAGGYGMLEYPMQIWEATQVDYRNPFITAAGPVVGTFNDGISSMYGAFVAENRDTVKFGLIEISVE